MGLGCCPETSRPQQQAEPQWATCGGRGPPRWKPGSPRAPPGPGELQPLSPTVPQLPPALASSPQQISRVLRLILRAWLPNLPAPYRDPLLRKGRYELGVPETLGSRPSRQAEPASHLAQSWTHGCVARQHRGAVSQLQPHFGLNFLFCLGTTILPDVVLSGLRKSRAQGPGIQP